MSNFNESKQKAIAKALGSNRSFSVKKLKLGTPLSWFNLANEIKWRLISTGGRPSDPYWDTKRLVPFRKKVWDYLTYIAKELSYHGRKVGPAQLAAIIIEDKVRQPMTGSIEPEIRTKFYTSMVIVLYIHGTTAESESDPTKYTSKMSHPHIYVETSEHSTQLKEECNYVLY
jgi:hypothetical protein